MNQAFARISHEFLGVSAGPEFEIKIMIKRTERLCPSREYTRGC